MFTKEKAIYLTFGDSSLKAIVVEEGKKLSRVSFTDRRSLPPEVVFDEKVVDFVRFKEEVRGFLLNNRNNFKAKKVYFGINEQDSFFTAIPKQNNVEASIQKVLAENLPYQSSDAVVRYHQIVDSLEISSLKKSSLADLDSIFSGTEFSEVTYIPLPLAAVSVLPTETKTSVLIYSEESSLAFVLISKGAISFSATLKYAESIEKSQKEIVKTSSALKQLWLQKEKNVEPLALKFFVCGEKAEEVKQILNEENLNCETLPLLDRFEKTNATDFLGYTKSLLLFLGKDATFSYAAPFNSEIKQAVREAKLKLPVLDYKKLFFAATIVLILFALFFLFRGLFFRQKPASSVGGTVVVKESQKKATPSAQTSSQPTNQIPPVNKSDYKIEVLNGTDTPRLASQGRDFLVQAGYNVVAIGNADKSDYQQTQIQIKPSKGAITADLTSTLASRYSVITGPSLTEDNQFDIIIILGRK